MVGRQIFIITLFSLAFACTSRVDHESQSVVVPVPDAININTATVYELERLPGIGEKTAEAIVQFRTENGPFRRAEHVLQIRGISEKRFNEFRHLIKTQ